MCCASNHKKHDQRSSPIVSSPHNLQRAEREKAACANRASGFLHDHKERDPLFLEGHAVGD
jgi:hypothetical protein